MQHLSLPSTPTLFWSFISHGSFSAFLRLRHRLPASCLLSTAFDSGSARFLPTGSNVSPKPNRAELVSTVLQGLCVRRFRWQAVTDALPRAVLPAVLCKHCLAKSEDQHWQSICRLQSVSMERCIQGRAFTSNVSRNCQPRSRWSPSQSIHADKGLANDREGQKNIHGYCTLFPRSWRSRLSLRMISGFRQRLGTFLMYKSTFHDLRLLLRSGGKIDPAYNTSPEPFLLRFLQPRAARLKYSNAKNTTHKSIRVPCDRRERCRISSTIINSRRNVCDGIRTCEHVKHSSRPERQTKHEPGFEHVARGFRQPGLCRAAFSFSSAHWVVKLIGVVRETTSCFGLVLGSL